MLSTANVFVGHVPQISYVQGMNVVCAPFLYVMPEVDAFFAFSQFVKFYVPLYFHPLIEGAYVGLNVSEIYRCRYLFYAVTG